MLRLGLMLGYGGKRVEMPLALVQEAEALGFDSVWVSEAYGSDAVTSATWLLARTATIRVGTCVMQMPARTPALTAMTAMSLDQLSGGRFIAGLGASGPQVVEGWHGVPYGKPITRFREYSRAGRSLARRRPAGRGHHLDYCHRPARGFVGISGLPAVAEQPISRGRCLGNRRASAP